MKWLQTRKGLFALLVTIGVFLDPGLTLWIHYGEPAEQLAASVALRLLAFAISIYVLYYMITRWAGRQPPASVIILSILWILGFILAKTLLNNLLSGFFGIPNSGLFDLSPVWGALPLMFVISNNRRPETWRPYGPDAHTLIIPNQKGLLSEPPFLIED